MEYIAGSYIFIMNVIAGSLFIIDKQRARKKGRRIPEKTLFLCAFLGGSPSILLLMHVIRHKTRKKKFSTGIPVLLVFQVLIITAAVVTTVV
ncbi:DUF1294 domain-containing protein [Thalassorhabdus alkalitolerans]|nr:DUF1294 domain-containing protein [Thalassobacillus sp. C254]